MEKEFCCPVGDLLDRFCYVSSNLVSFEEVTRNIMDFTALCSVVIVVEQRVGIIEKTNGQKLEPWRKSVDRHVFIDWILQSVQLENN